MNELQSRFEHELPSITSWEELPALFTPTYFSKPLILIVDEFDALDEEFINSFANEFRKVYTDRLSETDKLTHEKSYILHGLALIGVRSVIGIENVTGSPFNVQRSLHIPNLTFEEVEGMFKWYEQESGHHIESDVIARLYCETNGQPGLTCWFGELLTEGFEEYQVDKTRSTTMKDFKRVYLYATDALPNNTLINIISKAKHAPYKDLILEFFETDEKLRFKYNDPNHNFFYMHGVIDREEDEDGSLYLKFACPYIQKGLFDYFSGQLFREMGRLVEPFESLDDAITDQLLYLPNIIMKVSALCDQKQRVVIQKCPQASGFTDS